MWENKVSTGERSRQLFAVEHCFEFAELLNLGISSEVGSSSCIRGAARAHEVGLAELPGGEHVQRGTAPVVEAVPRREVVAELLSEPSAVVDEDVTSSATDAAAGSAVVT